MINNYLELLQDNLVNNKSFALIRLPTNAPEKQPIYYFNYINDQLIDENGNKLLLHPFPDLDPERQTGIPNEKEHYLRITQKAIDTIHSGKFEKVVLARTKIIDHVNKSSLVTLYKNLLGKYPHACVFILYTRETGLWIGASPELLVEKHNNNYHTAALAATNKSSNPKWSAKDYTEHKHVVSYIERELKKPEIKNVIKNGPYDFQYGNITHLKTDIHFSSSLDLQSIVNIIHPTPALCGYPKKKALEFIQQHEAHPRNYYTGSLIIQSVSGDGTAFAFLRCGRFSNNSQLTLYAGCGIVSESIPLNEWEESEIKIASILNCL